MTAAVKYLLDEQVSHAVAKGLASRGIDVLTVQARGLAGAADDVLLAWAERDGHAVFTQDEDFLRLAAAGAKHAGIVYAHQQTSVGAIIRGLVLIHQVLTPDEMRGHIEYL